jgi:formylglycine-generating enzyme required for sulfatase activity
VLAASPGAAEGQEREGAAAGASPAPTSAVAGVHPSALEAARARPLVAVPAGVYRPLRAPQGAPREVPVAAFRLDRCPVTNEEFLAFVREVPAWRRSRVDRLFADEGYLSHWAGDLDLGDASPRAPATRVSWFAARAYARWCGRRLPTTAEWERAASDEAMAEPALARRILDWYARPTPPRLPDVGGTPASAHGAFDLHGLVWEWTEDFGSALLAGDGRGEEGAEGGAFCGGGAVGATRPEDYAAFMRFAMRASLEAPYSARNLGFRCAARDAR